MAGDCPSCGEPKMRCTYYDKAGTVRCSTTGEIVIEHRVAPVDRSVQFYQQRTADRRASAAEIIRRQATRIANAAAAGGGYHGFKNG